MQSILSRRQKFHLHTFLRHDLKASVTVFFVALPLCLGVSLASQAPVYSGIIAGIIGGVLVSLFSKSQLSVSGPAAGLTAICATAIGALGGLEAFFIAVAIAGLLQVLMGVFKLGGFTHFIPSAVIKGMLTAIGIILIAKQIPLLIGYNKPDFWRDEFINLFTFSHGFKGIKSFYESTTRGAVIISSLSILVMFGWQKWMAKKIPFLPSSFVIVLVGSLAAIGLSYLIPSIQLNASQFVSLPENILSEIHLPSFKSVLNSADVWRYAVIICFVATLETLLSIEAIDKLDPNNRITPQNRELMAQGTGNLISGLLGGLPITAVIVRSSANAEAGARTKNSSIAHGVWLLLAILFAVPALSMIPFCVLAVILIRTGYNLAKPKMIWSVYKQGREQFLPFMITVVAILLTDLLIGVIIGIIYAIYFLMKHTYRAGFIMVQTLHDEVHHYHIELASNVSFLNKKRVMEMLDKIPEYSVVHIAGTKSVYIDRDILEIIQDFKPKAHKKHIELHLTDVPEVETIGLH